MTWFDLLFLVSALVLVVSIAWAGVSVLRGRRAGARVILGRAAVGILLYFAVLLLVSIASPGRRLAIGQPLCSDDWCIAVTSAQRNDTDSGRGYLVTFQLTSRARAITQRERFVVAWLEDGRHRRFDAVLDTSNPPFDATLGPLQSLSTTRRFDVPANAKDLAVIIAREGGGNFPRCCVIGEDNSLLHTRARIPLP